MEGGEVSEPIDVEVVEERSVAALHPAVIEHPDALVRPAAAIEQVRDAFHAYQRVYAELLAPADFQVIAGKRFPKKSAWRKLAVAFGVSFDIKERVYERDERNRIVRAEFVVTATAPNGRRADGFGACDLFEKCCPPNCTKGGPNSKHKHCADPCPGTVHFSNSQHDLPATAETRAKNRAASDLFGMGEVSAEEMNALRDEGWWGGWPSEEDMRDAHDPVVDWLRTADPGTQAVVKAWREERGWKLPLPREDFTEFAAFVAELRARAEGSRDPAPQAPSGEKGGGDAERVTAAAALPPCRLCDHPHEHHGFGEQGTLVCHDCRECPGYEAELPSDQNRELFETPGPEESKAHVAKAREQLREPG